MTIRLEANLLDWLRQQSGYQTRINAILRSYMKGHENDHHPQLNKAPVDAFGLRGVKSTPTTIQRITGPSLAHCDGLIGRATPTPDILFPIARNSFLPVA